MSHRRVLLVALIAAVIGAGAGWYVNGAGPLWESRLGQGLLQRVADTGASAVPAGVTVAEVGDAMPPLRLPALDGGMRALPADFAGRPLLINVWASWCGPCIEEMPELQRYSETQGTNGVQVIGLALDEAEAVRGFLHRVAVRYPILLDTPGPADASVRLGNRAGALPYSVLIDANGRIVGQQLGPFAPGELDGFDDVLGKQAP